MRSPNGQIQIFESFLAPRRFTVQLNEHIIGVLRFDPNEGATIQRIKVGREPNGRGIYEKPTEMRVLYPTTREAAEAVETAWRALYVETAEPAAVAA